jgi:hypothetical protein
VDKKRIGKRAEMNMYQTIFYKVEDMLIKLFTKKEKYAEVKAAVEQKRIERKHARLQRQQEKERLKREREEQERRKIEAIISNLMDNVQTCSPYEYNEIKRNKVFFNTLIQRVFEPNEKALAFIFCEYDKSSKKEIFGYLIPTNKRIIFVNKRFSVIQRFRYQTVRNVNWFKDGLLERGLKIQYGKRRLEFDEMFDQDQLIRVGNMILNKSRNS